MNQRFKNHIRNHAYYTQIPSYFDNGDKFLQDTPCQLTERNTKLAWCIVRFLSSVSSLHYNLSRADVLTILNGEWWALTYFKLYAHA